MITDHRSPRPILLTAAEAVYADLRSRIVSSELQPGSPLVLTDLANDFGTSTMPIRSALDMLEGDGLINRVRHRGAAVAPLELEDLELIQAVRTGIEGFAARVGAPALAPRQVDEIVKLLARCQELARRGPPEAVLREQQAMHDICYRAAQRPRLLEAIHQYRRRAERYIRKAIDMHALQQLYLQQRFVEACQDGDGEAASEALCEALSWTVSTLRPVILGIEQQAVSKEPGKESAAHLGQRT